MRVVDPVRKEGLQGSKGRVLSRSHGDYHFMILRTSIMMSGSCSTTCRYMHVAQIRKLPGQSVSPPPPVIALIPLLHAGPKQSYLHFALLRCRSLKLYTFSLTQIPSVHISL